MSATFAEIVERRLAGEPADPSTYFAGYPREQVSPFGVPTAGAERGRAMQIMSSVVGSEVASLFVDSPTRSLFASIQHPGEGGTLTEPTSHWPTGSVPLPAVVVITREDGGPIGG